MRTDVVVLGAGIVGTCVALHLLERGAAVVLVDRRGPGEETSYGNAGVIETDTVFPPPFPSDLGRLAKIALGRAPEASWHAAALPRLAPWLAAYRSWSAPERLAETATLIRPLFARAVAEHEAIAAEAGAGELLRRTGWLKLYRREESFTATTLERKIAAGFGIPHRILDRAAVHALEPSLSPVFARAVHWERVASVSDPLALTRAYAARFVARGGRLLVGDARTLRAAGAGWRAETADGPVEAEEAVMALGPWAGDLLRPLGIALPLAVKRGYHRHYAARDGATLGRPVVDVDHGYVLAPMRQGIRLTTGAEFADRDAPPTPVQLDQVHPAARRLFPLGAGIEATPWLGSRPCLPDSRPAIGRAPGRPGQAGLWLAVGHAHWGLTLGPATGRLLAEMMAGTTPFCDPAPFRADRFG